MTDRQQALKALAHANEIRLAQAELKRQIKRGEITPAEAIRENPEQVASMRIGHLLGALPHYGPVRVARVLDSLGMRPEKRAGTLTERQINLIEDELA